MRIVVDVQDLRPGRPSSYTAGSYVRAVLKVRALRRELAHTLLEVERCRKAFNSTAGAFDVLAKPFGMATLQNLVAQAMRVAPRP